MENVEDAEERKSSEEEEYEKPPKHCGSDLIGELGCCAVSFSTAETDIVVEEEDGAEEEEEVEELLEPRAAPMGRGVNERVLRGQGSVEGTNIAESLASGEKSQEEEAQHEAEERAKEGGEGPFGSGWRR